MYKPKHLRDHLTKAVPEFARDPDKLSLMVSSGNVVCAGTASHSWEYRYTLQVVVLDYTGAADAVVLPVLTWLREHQTEYLDNPEWREKNFRFNVDYLNSRAIDLMIELELTERVIVQANANGSYRIEHASEPQLSDWGV